jgi:hypothetical protein
MHTLLIKTVCGEHCTDVSKLDGLLDGLGETTGGEDILRISFSEVKSLTPSCGSSIVLQIRKLKSRRPGIAVQFTDLTANVSNILSTCLSNGVEV